MKTAEDILKTKTMKMVTIDVDVTVYEAVEKMVGQFIGAILVKKGDEIIGIWTERDLLRNLLEPNFNPKVVRIGDYMQTNLKTVRHDDPILKLEEMFIGFFIRHILVKKEEAYIGMLSIGDVIRSSLLEKDTKIKELNKIASWEYYENWGWHHKYENRRKPEDRQKKK